MFKLATAFRRVDMLPSSLMFEGKLWRLFDQRLPVGRGRKYKICTTHIFALLIISGNIILISLTKHANVWGLRYQYFI